MKIFITGGNGFLGQKLKKYLTNNKHTVCAPDKETCDILDLDTVKKYINAFSPEIVIHLAAVTDTFWCEKNIEETLNTNILGTLNMVKACSGIHCKFVYVSSEYVFKGDRGNYSINDKLDPINVYGKTKASSEYMVSILPNYQIIRAPFIKKIYSKVFTNQYCSRYFLDEVVEKISNNIFNNSNPLIHIASERNSLHGLYLEKGIEAEPVLMDRDQLKILPQDTSLINYSI